MTKRKKTAKKFQNAFSVDSDQGQQSNIPVSQAYQDVAWNARC